VSVISIIVPPSVPFGQSRESSGLETLLVSLASEHDIGKKEAVLTQITRRFGEVAGPGLIDVATRAEDADTRWMAIRGIGYAKFALRGPWAKFTLTPQSRSRTSDQ
jgi:hypothetical protein